MTKSSARRLFSSIQIWGVLAVLAASSAAAQEPPAAAKPAPEEAVPAEAVPEEAAPAEAAPEAPSDDEEEASSEEESATAADYKWHTAAGRYADPTSFFSLHGYVNGVFAGASPDWNAPDPSKLEGPGQVHIPNTPYASMGYDAALVVSSQIGEVASLLLELHFITEPSGMGKAGPGALAIGIPEAAVSLDLIRDYLTLSAGQFHAPFANVNTDWLLAQNLFTFMPKALGAFPTHWNERGVRVNGAAAFGKFGVNYVASVGNGVQNFNISGQWGYDRNAGKTYMARVGLFPGLGKNLEIAYSFATGRLRNASEADAGAALGSPSRYQARLQAHGVDATLHVGGLRLSGLFILAAENLEAATVGDNPADLGRTGFMAEADYRLKFAKPLWIIASLVPKVRYDQIQKDSLTADGTGTTLAKGAVYSFGVNIYPKGDPISTREFPYGNIFLSLEYHIQDELDRPDLDNNRFVARLTGRF